MVYITFYIPIGIYIIYAFICLFNFLFLLEQIFNGIYLYIRVLEIDMPEKHFEFSKHFSLGSFKSSFFFFKLEFFAATAAGKIKMTTLLLYRPIL